MKNTATKEQLASLRHSTAHLLAAAVMQLWPDTKRAIGPAIDDGFYFDFEFAQPISESDIAKIEKTMRGIAPTWKSFERHELSAVDAKKEFPNNPYKHELIDEFSQDGKKVSFYKSGDYWDLCAGGHCEHPDKELAHFTLTHLAGAYWRGSEKNKMLTRIYGTAFPSKKELDEYITMREEAKKRDHRKLGKELDLFTFSDLVGPGLPLWTPNGTILRYALDEYVWELRKQRGYTRVEIPHITKKDLFEVSGHWDKFKEELFRMKSREGHEFAMKPMNCPHHTQLYKRKKWSYRELPQRYANTTMCYRDEQTGELHGLSRLRAFTQDDAHVFCRASQVKEEMNAVWDIIQKFYGVFGFELSVRLSFHDPSNMNAYLGGPDVWKTAEAQLTALADERGVAYETAIGEAAFYGPKIDFISQDSIGRKWQVATIQLDMNLPERFDLSCVSETGTEERIVMIHAAIMGSIERFIATLIEHTAGNFPLWLAPEQVRIASVNDAHHGFCTKLAHEYEAAGIRALTDLSSETVGNKVRKAAQEKIPYLIIIGEKEAGGGPLAVRVRGEKNVVSLEKNALLKTLAQRIATRNPSLDL